MNVKKRSGTGPGSGADGIRQKGFYAALYSCVGAMLVLAVIIGYSNFAKSPAENEPIAELPPDYELGLSAEGIKPFYPDSFYQAQDPAFNQEGTEVSSGVESYLTEHPEAAETGLVPDNSQADYGEVNPPDDFASAMNTSLTGTQGEETDPSLEALRNDQAANPTPAPAAPPAEPKETFRSFNETADKMSWPVLGDIVMNYSADHLIYDKTLEQYRTNNNICIGARQGTPVSAAADGIVKEIYSTRESGKSIVVDHGNGWTTTYSQLQDEVLVKAGDVVTKGQTIGSIGSPSIFSSQLGYHLAFAVQKDYHPVDPKIVLQ